MSFGVAASIGGAVIGGIASEDAAGKQVDAANNATNTQLGMFNTINQQQAPYRQSGTNSLYNLNYLLGYSDPSQQNVVTDSSLATQLGMDQGGLLKPFSASDLNANLAPNYGFMLNQGLGATANAGNLQTGLLSGNTLKGINDYAQNYASNGYQQAYNNYNTNQTNIFNRLSDIAGLGQTANATTAQAGTSLAQGAAGSQQAAGQAAASGIVGGANAATGGLNNAFGWYNLNNLINPGSGTGGSGGGSGGDSGGASGGGSIAGDD